MAKQGKRLRAAAEGLTPDHSYELAEAVKLMKERAKAKFDETIELALNLNIDPRKADQTLRGVVSLPHGTGKVMRVAVFARGAKADAAKAAGADIVGAEELVDSVQSGKIEFDRCIATPDMMALVGRLGKVLGPRGLMPNPKLGTVTMDVAEAVLAAKGGQVQYRAEKSGIVHAGVGKASFSEAALVENIKTFVDAIAKARPAGVKGTYIKKISLSSTMGVGVKPRSVYGCIARIGERCRNIGSGHQRSEPVPVKEEKSETILRPWQPVHDCRCCWLCLVLILTRRIAQQLKLGTCRGLQETEAVAWIE